MKAGTPPAFSRSINCQIVRGIEDQEVSERTFLKGKAELKSSLPFNHGIGQPSAGSGVPQAQSRTENSMPGLFEDTPTALGFTMLLTTQVKAPAGTSESKRVVAALIAPVNGRLLSFYASASYTAEADRQWAEQAVKTWSDAVVAANPRHKGSLLDDIDFNRVWQAALIGALVGGVIHLVRRFRRRAASKAR